MNELVTTTEQEPTMSSKEIAELCESQHGHIKISMERLRDKGLITFFAMREKSTGGRPLEVYCVNQRDSYVVVAQNCPEFTARLVDRWQELEKVVAEPPVPQFQVPQTFHEALLLAAQQQEKIARDAPKVAYVDEVLGQSEGLMSLSDFGRVLKDCNRGRTDIGAKLIFVALRNRGVIMFGKSLPFDKYIRQQWFVVNSILDPYSGNSSPVTFVTEKGKLKIYELLNLNPIEGDTYTCTCNS